MTALVSGRRGIVMPIVLVSLMLLASMVLTFQFLSSSDYKQVGRMVRGLQATALADMAADEVYASIASVPVGPGGTKPQWVTDLLAALDGAKGAPKVGADGVRTLDTKQSVDFSDKIPQTQAAAAKTGGLVDVKSVKVVMGPFEIRAAALPAKSFYEDTDLGDTGKDGTPFDLRGPLSIEVAIKASRGPLDFSQRYLRGQQLEITDTTPPACEFATFSYVPPPSNEYALNDMQRGGKLSIDPKTTGRVFIRGPLLVIPEEAMTDKLAMGGPKPLVQQPSYPSKKWLEWGAIPGPRTLQHPQRLDDSNPVSSFLSIAPGIKSDMQAVRPLEDHSHTRLKTNSFPVKIKWDIGIISGEVDKDVPAMDKELGDVSFVLTDLAAAQATYQTIDDQEIAYYPPGAYMYGLMPKERQTFAVKPADIAMWSGALVHPNATAPALFKSGMDAKEGDCLAPEPVPNVGGGAADIGLIGVYGTAAMQSFCYAKIKTFDSTEWLMKKYANEHLSGMKKSYVLDNLDDITNQILPQIHVDPKMDILFRRFYIEAPNSEWMAATPTDLDAGTLTNSIKTMEAVVAPYGLYRHEEGFWKNAPVPADLQKKVLDAIYTPLIAPGSMTPDQICDGFLNNPDGWKTFEASLPTPPPKVGDDARQYLRTDYAKTLLAKTAGKDAGTPEEALTAILDAAKMNNQPKGVPPLNLASASKRPNGAFGDYGGPPLKIPDDIVALGTAYAKGFFPPNYCPFETIATRSYADMASYVKAESAADGALELKGAVLIQKMDYSASSGGHNLTYRGRGIIICVSETDTSPSLDVTIGPAAVSPANELILVHRVKPELIAGGKLPPLKLGSTFEGCVYSDTGVTGAGSGTVKIIGNLVTGLLNKKGVSGEVSVTYRETLKDAAKSPRAPFWTVEQSGEVLSVEPAS